MINSIYIIHINEFFTFKLISLNWKNRLYPQSIFFFEKLAGSKPIICLILQDTFRAHSKIRIYCLSKHKYLKKLTFFSLSPRALSSSACDFVYHRQKTACLIFHFQPKFIWPLNPPSLIRPGREGTNSTA